MTTKVIRLERNGIYTLHSRKDLTVFFLTSSCEKHQYGNPLLYKTLCASEQAAGNDILQKTDIGCEKKKTAVREMDNQRFFLACCFRELIPSGGIESLLIISFSITAAGFSC